jgi:hypothetical protein
MLSGDEFYGDEITSGTEFNFGNVTFHGPIGECPECGADLYDDEECDCDEDEAEYGEGWGGEDRWLDGSYEE